MPSHSVATTHDETARMSCVGTHQQAAAMRTQAYGRDATIIGELTANDPGRVVLQTRLGTTRIVEMLTGDLLPRIC